MEPMKAQSEDFKEQVSSISSSHPPEGIGMHRDNESIDDFEHLDPELSLVKEFQVQESQNKTDHLSSQEPISDFSHAASAVSQNTSEFSDLPVTRLDSTMEAKDILQFAGEKSDSSSGTVTGSASALVGGHDIFKTTELPDKMTFSQEPQDLLGFSVEAAVKPDSDVLISTHEKLAPKFESEFDIGKLSSQKALSQAFMDTERENIVTEGPGSHKDIPSKLTADVDFQKSESKPTDVPVLDLDNLSSENYHSDGLSSSLSRDTKKHHEDIQDIFDTVLNPPKSNIEPEIGTSKFLSAQDEDDLPSQEEAEPKVEPTPVVAEPPLKPLPSAPELIKPVAVIPEPSVKPEMVAAVEPNINVSPDKPSIRSTSPVCPVKTKPEVDDSDLEEIKPIQLFHYIGLDAWFKPDRLHPKVVELVYWRDPKKSGIVFGSVLGILLSLSYFSLISVVAYVSLVLLTGTISFRIYKNVLQAVQKTSDGHPFKDILELDLTLPQDKVREVTDVAVAHVNAAALELRRLFLVEDLVDSIKFGVLLWCLTYLGSWFNGMTLIIIAFVALFTLPKVYESNKAQIDQNLDIVRSKIADITSKVKAAIPIGKKPVAEEEKKGQ